MTISISQKLNITLGPELLITIAIHLLLFNILTFNFNAPINKPNAQITFLGAILDPLEIEKVKRQNYFSPKIPIIFSPQNQKTLSRDITAPAKPRLNPNIGNRHKIFFKSPPDPDILDQKKEIPWEIPTKNDNLSLPRPYQHLKL